MALLALVCTLLQLYVLVLIARAVCSWFPVQPGSPFEKVVRVLYQVTEPLLGPFRRIIPAVGMFDLSFLVAILAIQLVAGAICGGGLRIL